MSRFYHPTHRQLQRQTGPFRAGCTIAARAAMIHFLIIRDGTGFIQAVLSKAAVGDEMFGAPITFPRRPPSP